MIWKGNKAHEWIIEGTKADGDTFEAGKRLELDVLPEAVRRVVPTFSEFCERHYAPHAEQHLKASTWNVRTYILATLIEFFGATKISAIGTAEIERYKRESMGRIRTVRSRTYKAGATAINNELQILKTVLNFAASLSYPVAKAKAKRLPTRGKRRVRAWTSEELEALWAACREVAPAVLPVLLFLVNTGCRKGEALAAEWAWMDFEAGMIRIPSNEHWQPKNDEPREVPMSDAVRAVLSGPRRNKTFVFATRSKRQFQKFPESVYRRARDLAGLAGGAHQLRHTFAAHFLAKVPDLYLLSQILGHSHQRVTELYAHLLPDHLQRARNVVNISPSMAVTMATTPKRPSAQQKTR